MWFRLIQGYGSWNRNRVHFLIKQSTFHVTSTTDQYKSQIGLKFSIWIHSQIWPSTLFQGKGERHIHSLCSDPVQKSLNIQKGPGSSCFSSLVYKIDWYMRWIQDKPPWSPEKTWENADSPRDDQYFPGQNWWTLICLITHLQIPCGWIPHRLLQWITNVIPQFLRASKLQQRLLSLCRLIQTLFVTHNWNDTSLSSSTDQLPFSLY